MKLKIGDLICISRLNGKDIEDKGIVVEIFKDLFFYYSYNEDDLKRKIKTLYINGKDFDKYELISTKDDNSILSEYKIYLNNRINLNKALSEEFDFNQDIENSNKHLNLVNQDNKSLLDIKNIELNCKENKRKYFNKKRGR